MQPYQSGVWDGAEVTEPPTQNANISLQGLRYMRSIFWGDRKCVEVRGKLSDALGWVGRDVRGLQLIGQCHSVHRHC